MPWNGGVLVYVLAGVLVDVLADELGLEIGAPLEGTEACFCCCQWACGEESNEFFILLGGSKKRGPRARSSSCRKTKA